MGGGPVVSKPQPKAAPIKDVKKNNEMDDLDDLLEDIGPKSKGAPPVKPKNNDPWNVTSTGSAKQNMQQNNNNNFEDDNFFEGGENESDPWVNNNVHGANGKPA